MTDITDLSNHALLLAKSTIEEQSARIALLEEALRLIVGMDPFNLRADDLGRAARIARAVLNKETNRG